MHICNQYWLRLCDAGYDVFRFHFACPSFWIVDETIFRTCGTCGTLLLLFHCICLALHFLGHAMQHPKYELYGISRFQQCLLINISLFALGFRLRYASRAPTFIINNNLKNLMQSNASLHVIVSLGMWLLRR